MNILELLNLSSEKLKYKNIPSYKLDSEILISKVLKKKREEVLINLNAELNSKQIRNFNDLICRRSLKEPVAYILREKEFWSKKFEVSLDTLIPRPETELLVEKLSKIYKGKSISILDIGAGSGCILISLLSELNNAKGTGIDVSKKAVLLSNRNLKKHKMANRAKFLHKSVDDLWNNKFDLIVSNPPYLKRGELKNLDEDIKSFEPLLALDGGNDGLDVIRKVIYKAKEILKINGLLALEIGNGQLKNVSKILIKNNFRIKYNIRDYNENTRCIISSHLKWFKNMNNNRRRNFRPRAQKNNFRRRNGSLNSGSSNNFNNNGNVGFGRNGSINNIHNVEKAMLKFQQLAKDAQSNGDPVLAQNYLQHADHYLRRYNELNERKENFTDKSKVVDKKIPEEENIEKDLSQTSN